ncbi:MAG TPA: AMP-binding protein [Candidatus Acidoferrum sp.]|jgi:long-chain acyl-CoA synthetase|nr:AMP-binding protein [Candidatus Acidoferrum sp.]
MPNFLESLFAQLNRADTRVVLREIRGEQFVGVTGSELLRQVRIVRAFLRHSGIQPGDRCALLGPNSIAWVAVDLALMAEGVIVVPLYSRQAPGELAGMVKDCQPRLLFVSDAALGDAVAQAWRGAPPRVTLDQALKEDVSEPAAPDRAIRRADCDIVTIIYTSGTSGEPKGVCLNVGNVNYMLGRTTERLGQLMAATGGVGPERVFHYLPLSFAASWLLLLSCLTRETTLTLSTDLSRLADEIRLSSPNYFLNVPALLERVRRGVQEALAKRAAPVRSLFEKSQAAWQRRDAGPASPSDKIWVWLAKKLIFGKIKERFGGDLRALICGSAPLALETQQFFQMLGVPVLQAYGLTETTGVCTMDDPREAAQPGYVGSAIPGIEMKVGEHDEIMTRGPHIFPGYWNRPEETARVLEDGWFRTGDQGEMNAGGKWRIHGRIKNLIVLNSGHKVAPEPMEEKIARLLPAARHVVIVGNGRSYLCALIAGTATPNAVQEALEVVNRELPHYRQVRDFKLIGDALTPESGLLTAMAKLRRDAVSARFASEINAMYEDRKQREAVSRQHA